MAPSAVDPDPVVQAKQMPIASKGGDAPSTENMGTRRKLVIFSDFDGTIFMGDSGHVLFDSVGLGAAGREELERQFKAGERSFKEISDDLWGSLHIPFDDGLKAISENMELDRDFKAFHDFCLNNKIPFNIISAGLKPILKRVLDDFIGEEAASNIDIVANDAEIDPEGRAWKPIWKHQSPTGHDKDVSITEYKEALKLESEDGTVPMIIFIGDGVSDLAAAKHADTLFARRGLALEEYCIQHRIPYYPYDTFADIQKEIINIAKIDDRKTKGEGLPSNFNPRANLWRKASSKTAVPKFVDATPRDERMFVWPETFSEVKSHNDAVAVGK